MLSRAVNNRGVVAVAVGLADLGERGRCLVACAPIGLLTRNRQSALVASAEHLADGKAVLLRHLFRDSE